jgi:hypothetical protein
MLKSILNLQGAKSLSKFEQASVKGSFGRCAVFMCTLESEGCPCYNNPLSDDGVGCCMDGMCTD